MATQMQVLDGLCLPSCLLFIIADILNQFSVVTILFKCGLLYLGDHLSKPGSGGTCASDSSVASNPQLSQTWQAGAKTKILIDLLLSPQSWAEYIGLKWILHTPAVWSFLLPPKIDGTRWNRRNEKCRRRSFLVPLSLRYLSLQTE